MVQKIRKAIGQRDDCYTLEGLIEADEGYFSVEASKIEQNMQKLGRGSKTKANIMIMAESTLLQDVDTGRTDLQCRYFKGKAIENHMAKDADKILKEAIDGEKAIVFSNKSH
jgi:hypothetical protein